jgi:hypothetical protein
MFHKTRLFSNKNQGLFTKSANPFSACVCVCVWCAEILFIQFFEKTVSSRAREKWAVGTNRHMGTILHQIQADKVENILECSQDSIPSPSVKIQNMGGKVCLKCKGITLLSVVNNVWKKRFVDITQQCFALLPQPNFSAYNLNFH